MRMSPAEGTTPGPPAFPDPARRIVTVPNILSAVRLAIVPVFVWLFVTGRETAGVVLYGTGAWTDWIDGYIARRTGAITELGKLLDPLADRVYIAALAIALLIQGALPAWLGAVIIARDVAVLALFPIVDKGAVSRIPVHISGKAATAALLFGLTWLAVSETGFPWHDLARIIGLSFVSLGAGLYWYAAAVYARQALARRRDRHGDDADRVESTDRQIDT